MALGFWSAAHRYFATAYLTCGEEEGGRGLEREEEKEACPLREVEKSSTPVPPSPSPSLPPPRSPPLRPSPEPELEAPTKEEKEDEDEGGTEEGGEHISRLAPSPRRTFPLKASCPCRRQVEARRSQALTSWDGGKSRGRREISRRRTFTSGAACRRRASHLARRRGRRAGDEEEGREEAAAHL